MIGIFLMLFGALFVGIGFFVWQDNRSFVSKAATAEGIVVEMRSRTSRDSDGDVSTTYYPVVRFQPEFGEPITFAANFSTNPPEYRVEDRVTVYYNPSDPTDARLSSAGLSVWLPLIFGIVGGVAFVVGLIVLLVGISARRTLRRVSQ